MWLIEIAEIRINWKSNAMNWAENQIALWCEKMKSIGTAKLLRSCILTALCDSVGDTTVRQ